MSRNEIESPLTGMMAVVFFWRFSMPYREDLPLHSWWLVSDTPAHFGLEMRDDLAGTLWGRDFWVATSTGTLDVKCEKLTLVSRTTKGGNLTLNRPLPDQLASLSERAKHGPIHFQESMLLQGDRVRVEGFVQAVASGGHGDAYRTDAARKPSHTTVPDRARVRVVDRSLEL